jgi:HEAT repeat protein
MRWSGVALILALASSSGCGSRPGFEGKSVAELEQMLADADPKVQAQGAHGLSLKGAEAAPAVRSLISALKSSDVLREYAARALGQIGHAASAAVAALTDALQSPPWTVQRQAAIALGQIGPAAKSAVPALHKLTRDANRPLREAAQEALSKIRGVERSTNPKG